MFIFSRFLLYFTQKDYGQSDEEGIHLIPLASPLFAFQLFLLPCPSFHCSSFHLPLSGSWQSEMIGRGNLRVRKTLYRGAALVVEAGAGVIAAWGAVAAAGRVAGGGRFVAGCRRAVARRHWGAVARRWRTVGWSGRAVAGRWRAVAWCLIVCCRGNVAGTRSLCAVARRAVAGRRVAATVARTTGV